MSGYKLTSYTELADVLDRLPDILRDARRTRGLSLRAVASQMGQSFSTITRIEAGEECTLSNAKIVLRWLDQTRTGGAE